MIDKEGGKIMAKAITILRAAGVAIVFALLVFSCRSIPVAGVPEVSAYTQRLSPIAGAIVIANAVSVGPGWVAVFADDNGAPGELLGYGQVHDGLNFEIKVYWSHYPMPGQYIVQLQKDAGVAGKFEYPGPDEPVLDANGMPIMDRFTLIDYDGGGRPQPTP